MYSHKSGQLGNRLFAFSHLIANAVDNSYTIVNLSFDEYAKYFITTRQDAFCRYPQTSGRLKSDWIRSALFLLNRVVLKFLRSASVLKSVWHEVVVADLPEYQYYTGQYYLLASSSFQQKIRADRFLFLFGRFFRDYDALEKHQNIIRNYFRPIPEIQQNVSEFIERVRTPGKLIIGVHIRGGDYKEFLGGRYFYEQQDYHNKMLELQSSEPTREMEFIICSNEPIDVNLFPGLSCHAGPGHLVEDMYTFAACDFIVGPPSTYTRWASFYGNVPLFQLDSLQKSIRLSAFSMLEKEVLYNF